MQQPLDKQFTDLRKGLITEAGFLNTPEGATIDEENFRIFIDGSRRRRRGLKLEDGGSALTIAGFVTTTPVTAVGKWHNAGGDPDSDLIVVQLAGSLYFYKDSGDTLSSQRLTTRIPLSQFQTTGAAGDTTRNPCSFASGNGVLLVCGRYIEPFYLEYDPVTEAITPTQISLLERDFHTIEEGGVTFRTQPTTLTDAHKYNLRNRGWKQDDIDQYFTDKSKYPALGMLWYKGYARQVDGTTYVNEDGVKTWNSDKLEAEPFSNASAPTGSLLVNPFDTTAAFQSAPTEIALLGDWTYTGSLSSWTLTVNTAVAHGLTHPADITIQGQGSAYVWDEPEPGLPDFSDFPWTFDGDYTTASVPDTDTFTIVVDAPLNFKEWTNQYAQLGYMYTGGALENSIDSYSTNERPTVCGWFAGRAWFSGILHPNLTDRIYFSKLQYPMERTMGQCYQMNDPTDEVFNALLPDDGGTIVISDMGKVLGFRDFNGSWLVFTDNGVWEIRGDRGVFTADNYQVRKLSDNEATSTWGIAVCEGVVIYTGTKGIFIIQPDERTGILYAQNLSAASIQSLWNSIPTAIQKRTKVRYDDANKQVYILYSADTSGTYTNDYNTALVFDLRLQSWHKLTFPSGEGGYILDAVPMRDADVSEQFKKLKFIVKVGSLGDTIHICDMDQDDFIDFDGTEKVPYMVTAYDNIGSWANMRQAPKVHVYMAKTETGFGGIADNDCGVDTGDGGDGGEPAPDAYWEYSNFALTELHEITVDGDGDTYLDVLPEFDSLSRGVPRLALLEDGRTSTSVGLSADWHTLSHDLSTASTHVLTNDGSICTPLDTIAPIAGNYTTKQLLSTNGWGGPAHVITNGTWTRDLAPSSDALSSWNYAEAWYNPYFGGGIWWRDTGLFWGLRRTDRGNWNRIMRFPSLVGASASNTCGGTTDRLLPTAQLLNIDDGSTTAAFTCYVNPVGDRVYVMTSNQSSEPRTLKEYDANFDLLSETDLSSIALLDTAYPFAVLDDFLFFARGGHVYLYRLSTLQQVSQLYISAGTNTTVYPTRLLPHPDGALYVQHRYQGADVTQIVTLQWADATFVEDPSEGPDVPEPTPEGTCFDFITNPVNESSLKMQARWDWSDHINAGEWGSETQVYRHRRAYVPLELEDSFNTGYPVIVTRNKVRGRGRSLHLKFTGEEGKDAHLLGYGIRYAVSGRV